MHVMLHRFGTAKSRPKVYLQAGLHADEMPGPLILHHLKSLLEDAEIIGEILIVPLANPIGFAEWLHDKPQGRRHLASGQNFNRGFPDAPTDTPDENAALRSLLLSLSQDADHVLDLHCDHFAVPHLYTTPRHPERTDLLASCMGARLALIAEVSGGHAFDEANPGGFAATLEYRGQFDVSDALAQADALGLMTYLGAVGAIAPQGAPLHAPAPHLPLAGALEALAPQGGIVTWEAAPGDEVHKGQPIAQVTDPMTGLRLPVPAPCDGLLFRQELWRLCLRGQSLAHVAGREPARSGDLLSD
nr:succinylglutamate desuccinylase/aspartoacylase family protein [Stagnihabitans tardus]